MSSATNHRRRSHRSERLKASAFGGFKPAVSPSRNKYANKTGLPFGLSVLKALLTRHRNKKRKDGE